MASSSCRLSEDQFLCSICLDVFTDPITTPCGHNYCKTCITQYWDSSVVCQCPLCKESFDRRPKSSVNKVLSEMADQFRNSKHSSTNLEPAKPDEVSCAFCTEPKLKAVRSCLVCLASYCEAHLEPHHRDTVFKRHKLIDPVNNLEDIMCKKHDRPLELFCKTDHTCVCQFCTEGDHKLHQTVSLKEAYEGKKAELGRMEAEVQQMIQERQVKIHEVKHSVELSNKAADREIADSVKVFTALISCIERSKAELRNVIEVKQKTTERQAEGFIKELQQEITQLEKRSSELKQLSHTEDHLKLLQNFTFINTAPSIKDWTKVSVRPSSYVGTARTAVDLLKKTLGKEMEKLSCMQTEMNMRRPSKSVAEVRKPSAGAATASGATAAGETKEDCPICMENCPQMEKLKCGHELCKDCMIRLLETTGPTCPLCKDVFGKLEGDQPHGTMTWHSANFPLPGFPRCGTASGATAAGETKEDCPICMENCPQMEKLKCGHELCKDCMIRLLETTGPTCPLCKDVFGKLEGDQPHGTMTWHSANFPLPGFPRCGTASGATAAGETKEDCPICMENCPQMEKLKCGHELCKDCMIRLLETTGPTCPLCKDVFGKLEGDQPHGTMTWHSANFPLPGFPRCGTASGATAAGETKEDCPICMENCPQMEKLKCGHELCKDCMIRLLETTGPTCPLCKDVFGKLEGDQPHGTMTWHSANFPLPGFPRCGTITIDYNIPGGTQTEKHPNPGRYYHSTQRTAYLPNNKEGNEVVRLLRKAFDQKLIFTVGTIGSDDQVTWNGIPHKTSMSGGPERYAVLVLNIVFMKCFCGRVHT